MGKLSLYLENKVEDNLRKAAKDLGIAYSKLASDAIVEFFKNNPNFKEKYVGEIKKMEAAKRLKKNRESGKILKREISYGDKNTQESLEALNNSKMSKEEKKVWKELILRQSKERKEDAAIILEEPKIMSRIDKDMEKTKFKVIWKHLCLPIFKRDSDHVKTCKSCEVLKYLKANEDEPVIDRWFQYVEMMENKLYD